MKIPEKLLKKWETLRSAQDTKKMAAEMENGYPELFNRAFRKGECRDDVFIIMKEFYSEKEELIKEALS